MLNISIFALGIMPTSRRASSASADRCHPRFEELKKEGQAGQAKMTQYTRYLTIALAVLQSATLITFARNPRSCSVTRLHQHPHRRLDGDDPHHGAHHDRRHRPDHVAR